MLILASESASRRAMLEAAGVPHRAIAARIDEAGVTASMAGAPGRDVADRLAELKAVKLSLRQPDARVLGCDTVVELERGELLAKPATIEGLRAQLRRIEGRTHRLYSAAVVAQAGRPVWRHVGVARLSVRHFSQAWLDDYVAACGEAVLGSVGGYHLEGRGVQLFDKVSGDAFVVRGMPLVELLVWLRAVGAMPA